MKVYKTVAKSELKNLNPDFAWAADDWGWALVEFDDEKPSRVVGTDGGEPEDQLLVRDWKWVEEELNKKEAECEKRDVEVELVREEITALRKTEREKDEEIGRLMEMLKGKGKP